jgi:hypothetical protein
MRSFTDPPPQGSLSKEKILHAGIYKRYLLYPWHFQIRKHLTFSEFEGKACSLNVPILRAIHNYGFYWHS